MKREQELHFLPKNESGSVSWKTKKKIGSSSQAFILIGLKCEELRLEQGEDTVKRNNHDYSKNIKKWRKSQRRYQHAFCVNIPSFVPIDCICTCRAPASIRRYLEPPRSSTHSDQRSLCTSFLPLKTKRRQYVVVILVFGSPRRVSCYESLCRIALFLHFDNSSFLIFLYWLNTYVWAKHTNK